MEVRDSAGNQIDQHDLRANPGTGAYKVTCSAVAQVVRANVLGRA